MRKLMFLFSLGSMASMGPRLMPVVRDLKSGDTAALMASLQQALKNQNAAGEVQIDDQQLAQLQGLIESGGGGVSGSRTGDENTDISQDLQSIGRSSKPLVLQKLLKDMSRARGQAVDASAQAQDLGARVAAFWQARRERLSFWLWALPALAVALGIALSALNQPYWVRNLAEPGYALARTWLFLVALGTAGWALFQHTNPWPLLPAALYLPQILWLMGSAWLLHLLDPNYPSWNSMLQGLTAPLLSMGFVLLLPKVVSILPF